MGALSSYVLRLEHSLAVMIRIQENVKSVL